jgi:adenylate kinase
VSGTPGTGKSRLAAHLSRRFTVLSVEKLALASRSLTRLPDGTAEIDLVALGRYVRGQERRGVLPQIIVGHLAHRLPIKDVVILRCHPVEINRRLRRRGGMDAAERRENVEAEATDAILLESLDLGRKVWEIDTTRRPAPAVAKEVTKILRTRPPPRFGRVDWLADPSVTGLLISGARSRRSDGPRGLPG